MDPLFVEDSGLPHLVFGVLRMPRECALGYCEAADTLIVVIDELIIEIEAHRVIRGQRPLTSRVSSAVLAWHHNGLRKLARGKDCANGIAGLILVIAHVYIQRELVGDNRTAEARIEVPLLVWRPSRSERVPPIENGISKEEICNSMELACSRFGGDFGARKADPAKFGAERIVVDPDFLDLVLGRNTALGESIDHEHRVRAGLAARPGDLLQVGDKIVGLIRQRVYGFLFQYGRLEAGIRLDADLIFRRRDLDRLPELGDFHGYRQRSKVGRKVNGLAEGLKLRRRDFNLVFTGLGRKIEIAGGGGQALFDDLLRSIQFNLSPWHHRTRSVHDASPQPCRLGNDIAGGQDEREYERSTHVD